jgi:hypothetical protein
MNNYSAIKHNGTLMTQMNMTNTDKIIFNLNYQRHQRSIFLTFEKLRR